MCAKMIPLVRVIYRIVMDLDNFDSSFPGRNGHVLGKAKERPGKKDFVTPFVWVKQKSAASMRMN
jgi:hypothetical protein